MKDIIKKSILSIMLIISIKALAYDMNVYTTFVNKDGKFEKKTLTTKELQGESNREKFMSGMYDDIDGKLKMINMNSQYMYTFDTNGKWKAVKSHS